MNIVEKISKQIYEQCEPLEWVQVSDFYTALGRAVVEEVLNDLKENASMTKGHSYYIILEDEFPPHNFGACKYCGRHHTQRTDEMTEKERQRETEESRRHFAHE